jgi:hypothetical protein
MFVMGCAIGREACTSYFIKQVHRISLSSLCRIDLHLAEVSAAKLQTSAFNGL